MARISELHYSNRYAAETGVSEFLEIALDSGDDPANFTASFYEADGSLGFEIALDDTRVTSSVDPDSGEVVYVLSADNLPIQLTDPDGSSRNNFEAYALTQTGPGPSQVIDFYDIGRGTRNIVAQSGAAAGAVSENIPSPTGPDRNSVSIQFNLPNPDQPVYASLTSGDSGIACFTTGTLINTPDGPRLIEDLAVGDLVITQDNGAQPVRWIGSRRVAGQGTMAPVRVSKGTSGAEKDLLVSPRHRLLVQGWRAELLFGAEEVLVAAKDLVNDDTIRTAPCTSVTYVHILFDTHQIVETQGVLSESFLPRASILDAGETSTLNEFSTLFPDLAHDKLSYGPSARRVCTGREAEVMLLA